EEVSLDDLAEVVLLRLFDSHPRRLDPVAAPAELARGAKESPGSEPDVEQPAGSPVRFERLDLLADDREQERRHGVERLALVGVALVDRVEDGRGRQILHEAVMAAATPRQAVSRGFTHG